MSRVFIKSGEPLYKYAIFYGIYMGDKKRYFSGVSTYFNRTTTLWHTFKMIMLFVKKRMEHGI